MLLLAFQSFFLLQFFATKMARIVIGNPLLNQDVDQSVSDVLPEKYILYLLLGGAYVTQFCISYLSKSITYW